MSSLHIEQIFSQFHNYQQQYQEILNDPEQYYQTVENAHIHFALLSDEKIYLGDLLQLWFVGEWTDHSIPQGQQQIVESQMHASIPALQKQDLFLFAIENHGLYANPVGLAWSVQERCIKQIQLIETLPYYCQYISLTRPKRCN